MAFEELTPQEQHRRESAGERAPWGYQSWDTYRHEQVLSFRREGAGGSGPSAAESSLSVWALLVIIRIVVLIGAIAVIGGWVVVASSGYRAVLDAAFPEGVLADEAGGASQPVVAGVTVGTTFLLVAVFASLIRRRQADRGWDAGRTVRTVAMAALPLSVARTAAWMIGFPFVLGAIGIAQGKDLEPRSGIGPAGWYPIALVATALVWWSWRSAARLALRVARQSP